MSFVDTLLKVAFINISIVFVCLGILYNSKEKSQSVRILLYVNMFSLSVVLILSLI